MSHTTSKVEHDFIKIVCWATDNILKWFDEALEVYENNPALSSAQK